jgi:[protein-PII] uridylyltransferase
VNELRLSLADPDEFPEIVQRRLPRQLKHFQIRTEVSLSNDINNQRTAVEIITLDRPGLLARIGRIFMEEGLSLQAARIATLGERAEDVFFVTDANGQPLSDLTQCQHLIQTLRDQLDQNDA